MSQAGRFLNNGQVNAIETLTGDSGGPVSPDGLFNIDILGDGYVTVVGDPVLHTLTIEVNESIATMYATDSGIATPIAHMLDVLGGVGITTSGATNVVTIDLDIPVTVPHGGTGLTTLTSHGVLVGEGASSVNVTAAGTNGQVLIAATGADPAFATITSTGGTISFTLGANTLNMEASGITQLTVTSVNHAASPYTVLSTDEYLSCDVTAGVISILLPNAPSTGRVYAIKDKVGLAGTSNITVTTVGGAVTIDGSTSFVMNTAYESIEVVFNGTSYEVF